MIRSILKSDTSSSLVATSIRSERASVVVWDASEPETRLHIVLLQCLAVFSAEIRLHGEQATRF